MTVLARALARLLRDGQADLVDAYSATCLERVWRATHFSWWMTSMLHIDPGADRFGAALQLSQLRYVISSRAAATTLAENYTGYLPLNWLSQVLPGYPRSFRLSEAHAGYPRRTLVIPGPGGAGAAGPGRVARTAPRPLRCR